MLPKRLTLIFSLLMITALSACNLPSNQEGATSTPDLALTVTALAAPGNESTPATPENTATPEFTSTPAFTPTPSVPTVTVSINTNCRTGPGVVYPLVGGLNVGQSAEVIGKSTGTNYWIIKLPGSGAVCWLWGEYATISGNVANLQEYAIPPTPTPSIPAPVTNLNASISCVLGPFFVNDVEVNLIWSDAATNEQGYRIYREGTLLVTLAANSTNHTDTTTLPGIWVITDPQPSLTYEVEAYNGAGASAKRSVNVKCP